MPKKRKRLSEHKKQHESEEEFDENHATVVIDDVEQRIRLNPKTYSSGSIGHYGTGKLWIDAATRYQISVICTLIGSKPR